MGERSTIQPIVDGFVDRQNSPTAQCAGLGSATHLLRCAWAAAKIGKSLLPVYRAELARESRTHGVLDAIFCTLGIGLRHESARDDARRILQNARCANPKQEAWFHAATDFAIAILDKPDDAISVRLGQEIAGRRLGIRSDAVPRELAVTMMWVPENLLTFVLQMLLSLDAPYSGEHRSMPFLAAPLLATARAEDFYFPREIAARMSEPWTPEMTVEYVTRFDGGLAHAPVRAGEKTGRNEPCPCGSGKKFKRCCVDSSARAQETAPVAVPFVEARCLR
jgi:hypothetical protein